MNRIVADTFAPNGLPYQDNKPIGARDFYLAINATFRFIRARKGVEGLRAYWRDLGRSYYAPVSTAWKRDGLPGVAAYWRAFFAAEPGAVVEVSETEDSVCLDVQACPAIHHLRESGREIVPDFCQHCWFVGEEMASKAGFTLRVIGGSGTCRQTFYSLAHTPEAPQNLSDIATVTPERMVDYDRCV